MPDIAFPAFAISEGDSFSAVDSVIQRCSYSAWRNGYFDRLYYLDAIGLLWPVVAANRARIGLLHFLGKSIEVSVSLGDPIDDPALAKSLVCRLIENDPDDLYDQHLSHEEALSRLSRATTGKEVYDVAKQVAS